VDFVDDVDLVRAPHGAHVDVGPQGADLVDAAVRGTVDLDDINIGPFRDRPADIALIAGVAVASLRAIERFGENAGGGRLADPAGTGEEIGVGDPPGGDGVLQCLGNRLLSHDLAKRLRPKPACQHGVFHRSSLVSELEEGSLARGQ